MFDFNYRLFLDSVFQCETNNQKLCIICTLYAMIMYINMKWFGVARIAFIEQMPPDNYQILFLKSFMKIFLFNIIWTAFV